MNALLYHVGAGAVSFEDAEAEEVDDDALGLSVVNAKPQYEGSPTVRPGIVHRIDKDTSGLLVVAKNDRAHAHLSAQFERHTIERVYLGLVWGVRSRRRGGSRPTSGATRATAAAWPSCRRGAANGR